MKIATDTRNESFHALSEISTKQQAVLDTVKSYGPITDRDIADRLGWTINRVTGRRNELVAMGAVSRAGKVLDASTNRNVSTWGISSLATAEAQAPLATAPRAFLSLGVGGMSLDIQAGTPVSQIVSQDPLASFVKEAIDKSPIIAEVPGGYLYIGPKPLPPTAELLGSITEEEMSDLWVRYYSDRMDKFFYRLDAATRNYWREELAAKVQDA